MHRWTLRGSCCLDWLTAVYYFIIQNPEETVIDPTFAAPEHYVMPTSTPALPPDPFCSLVSPVVWLLNTPDRFDIYSAVRVLSFSPLCGDCVHAILPLKVVSQRATEGLSVLGLVSRGLVPWVHHTKCHAKVSRTRWQSSVS